jgi:hypothetical protein
LLGDQSRVCKCWFYKCIVDIEIILSATRGTSWASGQPQCEVHEQHRSNLYLCRRKLKRNWKASWCEDAITTSRTWFSRIRLTLAAHPPHVIPCKRTRQREHYPWEPNQNRGVCTSERYPDMEHDGVGVGVRLLGFTKSRHSRGGRCSAGAGVVPASPAAASPAASREAATAAAPAGGGGRRGDGGEPAAGRRHGGSKEDDGPPRGGEERAEHPRNYSRSLHCCSARLALLSLCYKLQAVCSIHSIRFAASSPQPPSGCFQPST